MIGEITIDGEVVQQTSPLGFGNTAIARMGYVMPEHGWRMKENNWVVGEYHALGLDLHGLSQQQLESVQADLTEVQNQLEAEELANLTKHDLVGNILQTGIMGYFAMTAMQDKLSAKPANIVVHRK